MQNPKFRWFSFVISLSITAGAVFGIYYFPLTLTYKQKTAAFESRKSEIPFNRSEEPIFVLHFSDVHVNHIVPKNNERFQSAVEYSLKMKPSMNILTGDLVDDFPYNDYPKYGSQQPKDWEIYRNITNNVDPEIWFEIAGNHDEWGVFSFDSNSHNFKKSAKKQFSSYSDFELQERVVKSNGGYDIHLIGFNPFVYPSAHPPFVYWPRPSSKLMDRIEKLIESIPEKDEIIIMDHYPLLLFPPYRKTSSGKNFVELMTTGKVNYFLSGHLHPSVPKILHHDNLLEVVAPDSKGHNYIGCFTYDNRRFVYHQVNITRPPKAFVTNPVPVSQLTNHQVFNELGTPLRVLSMHEKMPSIQVTGDLNGNMTCEKRTSGHFVCELENKLGPGQYSVSLTGSITKTVNFIIANKSNSYSEAVYKDVHNEPYIFQTAFLFCVLLIAFLPLPIFSFSNKVIKHLNGEKVFSLPKRFLMTAFGGILYIRFAIEHLHLAIRLLLFSALIYPLVLPAVMMEIEGHIGFIFMWGYVCGGKYFYAIWGQRNCLHYFLYILCPAAVFAASIFFVKHSVYAWIPVTLSFALCVAALVKNSKLVIRYVYESVGFKFAPSAPIHVLWPIIIYLVLISLAIYSQFKAVRQRKLVTNEQLLVTND